MTVFGYAVSNGTPHNHGLIGVMLGTLIGVLPALDGCNDRHAADGTFTLRPWRRSLMLAGIYTGAIGGSSTDPGESAGRIVFR